jgi:cytochrome P450
MDSWKTFSTDCDVAISFQGSNNSLNSLESIISSREPVEVKIHDNPIREPPGPDQLPFFGNYFELYPDHVGNHDRLFSLYGPVIKTVNMGTTTYLTNDVEVSRFVLGESEYFTKVTTNPQHPLYFMHDNTALFTCDTASPAFKPSHKFLPHSMSPKAVRHYSPKIHDAVTKSFNTFDELDQKNLAFNCYHYMFKLAGQIVYKLVLGMDLQHFDAINSPPHEIIRLLGEYLVLMKKVQLRPKWYSYLPFGPPRRLYFVRNRIMDLVNQAIQDRPKSGSRAGLPLDNAALEATCIADFLCRAQDDKGNRLAQEYVLSNCVVLVGAGFITSASFLSWLMYALVSYPGNQERLLQELIDNNTAGEAIAKDTTPQWSDLNSLSFLNNFVRETLRLHGPSFQTARNAKQDVILPGGYLLPKGSVIIPTFPSIHTHVDHWDNPRKFDPDRWDTERVKKRHAMSFTPFASGPRGCIGYNVALEEAKTVLARLVWRYQWQIASKEPVIYDPEFLVLRPLNFYARAVKRETWPRNKKHE